MRALVLCGAEVINYEQQDVLEVLNELTAGRGPDHCIEAVGMEAYRPGLDYWYDHAKQALRLQTGRPTAVREAVLTCRKGGTVAILGVFGDSSTDSRSVLLSTRH